MAFIVDISNPATFAVVSEEGREEAELVSTNESEELLTTDQSQDWKFKFSSVSDRRSINCRDSSGRTQAWRWENDRVTTKFQE